MKLFEPVYQFILGGIGGGKEHLIVILCISNYGVSVYIKCLSVCSHALIVGLKQIYNLGFEWQSERINNYWISHFYY